MLVNQGRVVVTQRADVDGGASGVERGREDCGVLDRLPDQFEHEPLLRVDGRGFARRDVEERRVEVADAVKEAAASGSGDAVPTSAWGVGDCAAALGQQLPVSGGVGCAGEAAG